jgi:hypothetical protein
MASVSPRGERAILALLAEQYTTIVELRETLEATQKAYSELVQALQTKQAEET